MNKQEWTREIIKGLEDQTGTKGIRLGSDRVKLKDVVVDVISFLLVWAVGLSFLWM